ncbi:MAG: recombinase family protein, partial [Verrucomicrobiaceae bacterium]
MKSVSAPQGKRVGIWIRVSTEDQAQGESPEHHEHRASSYAEARGWTVVELYDLAGVSGKSVMEHPEAKRMLADIKSGHITGIIFSKLARLARNTKELLDFSDFFRAHNADLVSVHESIDTSTPSGRLFYTMIAAMAQWEREEITDRINSSIVTRAKLGKPLNGLAPYGYKWHDAKLVIEPAEAPVRKLAYELFVQHRRKGSVSRLLNEAGHRTRNGCDWSDISIGRILRCPSAKGLYRLNVHRTVGPWKFEIKPESEWGSIAVEPIISEELWDQVNRLLEEQSKPEKRPARKVVQLFAGLAVCQCGAKMYVPMKTPKYVCFKCRNKIPIQDLEGIFYDELKAYFIAPERIAAQLSAARSKLGGKQELLAHQQAEVKRIKDEMAKTHRLYLDGKLPSEQFSEFFDPLNERLGQAQTDLAKLQGEVDGLRMSSLSAEEVVAEAEQLYSKWGELTTEDKRRIVEAICQKIVIGKDQIDITFCASPFSEQLTKSQHELLLTSPATQTNRSSCRGNE